MCCLTQSNECFLPCGFDCRDKKVSKEMITSVILKVACLLKNNGCSFSVLFRYFTNSYKHLSVHETTVSNDHWESQRYSFFEMKDLKQIQI